MFGYYYSLLYHAEVFVPVHHEEVKNSAATLATGILGNRQLSDGYASFCYEILKALYQESSNHLRRGGHVNCHMHSFHE